MERKIKIKELYDLIKNDGGSFEILTPDGFHPIGDVYKKNNKQRYKVIFENGLELIGSEDHLVNIETIGLSEKEINSNIEILDGNTWVRFSNLDINDLVLTKNGLSKPKSINKLEKGTTYDIEVLDDKHRYFSNDVISHNTGKSAIAEGLAQRIIQRKCSRILFNKRVVMLDLAAMVSGTKYRGQFEERIKALMTELESNHDVILFIDEIHTIIGAGGASGSLDASNMFKPALARGEMQIIGATTIDEYRKHIEKDGALERRFQKVMVEPASIDESLQILSNIKDKYESHHNVNYTDDAIKACVELTSRYMTDRFLPDKAIDALDEVGARVHISNIIVPKEITDIETKISDIKDKKNEVIRSQKYEEAAKLRDVERQLHSSLDEARLKWEEESKTNRQTVTEQNVAEVVSMMTGIPVTKVGKSENEKLKGMYDAIKGNVIGQDEAVHKIVKSIQRARMGMKDPFKPTFIGFCCGSSGVGKTELAKQIAKYLFDSEDSLIRLDMSEYMDKISSTKIGGASAGYVGYEEGSAFLNKVRTKPYSVILLDEIEKAHVDILNMFLQMFDEGHMTDSHGRKVSFKNCIILMTSNVGVRVLKDFGTGVGFSTKTKSNNFDDDSKSILEKELKKKFAPEFINRIDEIIYFKDIDKEDIKKIVYLELNKSIERLKNIGFNCDINENVIDKLVEVGYDPQFGARPMKRAIQRWFDEPITDSLMDEPEVGSTLHIKYDKDSDKVIVDIKPTIIKKPKKK